MPHRIGRSFITVHCSRRNWIIFFFIFPPRTNNKHHRHTSITSRFVRLRGISSRHAYRTRKLARVGGHGAPDGGLRKLQRLLLNKNKPLTRAYFNFKCAVMSFRFHVCVRRTRYSIGTVPWPDLTRIRGCAPWCEFCPNQ